MLTLACSPVPPLVGPELALPIACEPGRTCWVQNYFDHDPEVSAQDFSCRSRTYDGHDGTDFRVVNVVAMRAGVDVIASASGTVRALRDGEPEGMLRDGEHPPAGRECGNGVVLDHGGGWETQYCHLAGGSVAVAVGDRVSTGTRLGSVGLSGDTQFPHVHLAVRHDGVEIDPFAADLAPGACGSGASLWSPGAAAALAGPATVVLDAGFAAGPVSLDEAEEGAVAPPDDTAPRSWRARGPWGSKPAMSRRSASWVPTVTRSLRTRRRRWPIPRRGLCSSRASGITTVASPRAPGGCSTR